MKNFLFSLLLLLVCSSCTKEDDLTVLQRVDYYLSITGESSFDEITLNFDQLRVPQKTEDQFYRNPLRSLELESRACNFTDFGEGQQIYLGSTSISEEEAQLYQLRLGKTLEVTQAGKKISAHSADCGIAFFKDFDSSYSATEPVEIRFELDLTASAFRQVKDTAVFYPVFNIQVEPSGNFSGR